MKRGKKMNALKMALVVVLGPMGLIFAKKSLGFLAILATIISYLLPTELQLAVVVIMRIGAIVLAIRVLYPPTVTPEILGVEKEKTQQEKAQAIA